MAGPTVFATVLVATGLQANLPSSGTLGQIFFCTDTGNFFVWNGSTMVKVNGAAGSVSSFDSRTGAVTPQSGDYATFYDVLGAAAAAQAAAEAFATSAANTAQSNAEAFASNASNLTSGTLNAARLPASIDCGSY